MRSMIITCVRADVYNLKKIPQKCPLNVSSLKNANGQYYILYSSPQGSKYPVSFRNSGENMIELPSLVNNVDSQNINLKTNWFTTGLYGPRIRNTINPTLSVIIAFT